MFFFFFFQAEDGIRDWSVTGVQTCALPICSLIDEKLQLQEARRQSVTATEAEINTALEQIEKQNNMKSGQLDSFLQARGVDRGQLVDQLTASIVWAKLVRRQAAQTTEISDEEVDEALRRAKEHANEPQSRVGRSE